MSEAIMASRWFMAHNGQLQQRSGQVIFASAELPAAEACYTIDQGYGLAVVPECPPGVSPVSGMRKLLAGASDEA